MDSTAFSAVRSFIVAGAAMVLCGTPGLAAAPPRVRGIVTAMSHDTITVKQQNGSTVRLSTGPSTTYAVVVRSSLDEIRLGTFIGTAIKGPQDGWIAVEIVIVPEGMRAGRLGFSSWDPLPDTSGSGTSGTVSTGMTNGVVTGIAAGLTDTAMTNGTVVASEQAAAGRKMTVSLAGGGTGTIAVSAAVPVTRFELASRSVVAVGSTVFIKTDPGNRVGLLAVGKGVTPPM